MICHGGLTTCKFNPPIIKAESRNSVCANDTYSLIKALKISFYIYNVYSLLG